MMVNRGGGSLGWEMSLYQMEKDDGMGGAVDDADIVACFVLLFFVCR